MNPAIKELRRLAMDAKELKYPGQPYLTVPEFSDKGANGLTKCIIRYLQLKGWQCERVANMGKYVDQRQTYVDVLGHGRVIGSGKWIPGQGTKGSADIHAVINGSAVKIEVKIGRDRIKPDQLKYKEQVERAGGLYVIATSFEWFLGWYKQTFE